MNLKLYVIKNKEGKYFRAKGRDGSGDSWVADPVNARIYSKIGPARGVVSWFAKTFPSFGVPEIHELNITSTTLLDETSRVKKALEQKIRKEELRNKRQLEYKIKLAEKELKQATERLKSLKDK